MNLTFLTASTHAPGRPPAPRRQGFALVIALSLMAFILVLLVNLSALIRVESATAVSNNQQLAARQNALLGLQVAIGKLQRTLGPDNRVTARAELVANSQPEGAEKWIGAFLSDWAVNGDLNLNEGSDNGDLLEWLVSGADELESYSIASSDLGTTVEIAAARTFGSGAERIEHDAVRVPAVTVESNSENGRFAFWVNDENQKLNYGVADQTNRVRHAAVNYAVVPFQSNGLGENYSDETYVLPNSSGSTGRKEGNQFKERERLRQLAQQVPAHHLLLNRFDGDAEYDFSERLRVATLAGSGNLGDLVMGQTGQTLDGFQFDTLHDATDRSLSLLTNVPENKLRYDLSDGGVFASSSALEKVAGPDWKGAPGNSNLHKADGFSASHYIRMRHTPNQPRDHIYSNLRSDAEMDGDPHATIHNDDELRPIITEFGANLNVYITDENGDPVPSNPDPATTYYICVETDFEVEMWNPYHTDVTLDSYTRLSFVGWPRLTVEVSEGSVADNDGNSLSDTVYIHPDHLLFHALANPHTENRSDLNFTFDDDAYAYRLFDLGDSALESMKPGQVIVFGSPGFTRRVPEGDELFNENGIEIKNNHGSGVEGHLDALTPQTSGSAMRFILTGRPITFPGGSSGTITVTLDDFHDPDAIDPDFDAEYRSFRNADDYDENIFTMSVMSPGNLPDRRGNYVQKIHPPATYVGHAETYDASNNIFPRWGFGMAMRDDPLFFTREYDLRQKSWQQEVSDSLKFWEDLNQGSRPWSDSLEDNAGSNVPASEESLQFFSVTSPGELVGMAIFDSTRQEPLSLSIFNDMQPADLGSGGSPDPGFFGNPWGGDNNRVYDAGFFSTLTRGHNYGGLDLKPDLEDIRMGSLPNTLMVPLFEQDHLPEPFFGTSSEPIGGDDRKIQPNSVSGLYHRSVAALYLAQAAGFNINSTSTVAWEGILAGSSFEEIPASDWPNEFAALPGGNEDRDRRWRIHGDGGSELATSDNGGVLRNLQFTRPQNADYTERFFSEAEIAGKSVSPANSDSLSQDFMRQIVFHQGARQLSNAQVREMAEVLVAELKNHVQSTRNGKPFTSVREFVVSGILDQILDPEAGLLSGHPNAPFYFSPSENYRYTPAYLSQADMLGNVSHFLTPRGDTFRIRVYGDNQTVDGAVSGEAYGEAIVQRLPEPLAPLNTVPSGSDFEESLESEGLYLDPNDHPLGRRLRLVSFRWLTPEEI